MTESRQNTVKGGLSHLRSEGHRMEITDGREGLGAERSEGFLWSTRS